MDAVSEAVEHGSGETFAAQDFDPLLKGQIGGEDEAGLLVGPADDIKEQLGARLGEGHIAKLIEDDEVHALQLFVGALQGPVFALLQEMGDQARGGGEANAFALDAGGVAQGRGQMRFACARVADQEDVLLFLNVFPAQQLAHEHFVDGGLGMEVEGVDGFQHREGRLLEAPFGGAALPVNQLPLGQPQEVGGIISAFLAADGSDAGIVALKGRQL